jgi:hypothetical protein
MLDALAQAPRQPAVKSNDTTLTRCLWYSSTNGTSRVHASSLHSTGHRHELQFESFPLPRPHPCHGPATALLKTDTSQCLGCAACLSTKASNMSDFFYTPTPPSLCCSHLFIPVICQPEAPAAYVTHCGSSNDAHNLCCTASIITHRQHVRHLGGQPTQVACTVWG